MKNLFTFSLLCMAILCISCKTTKQTSVVEEEPVFEDAPVIMQSEEIVLSTQAVTAWVYYTIENNNGTDVFVEQEVLGDGEFGEENGTETLRIIQDGTGRVINCVKMMHPKQQKEVYVEIGGDTPERQH